MSTSSPRVEDARFLLTPADIQRAVAEGVLTPADAQRLIAWGSTHCAGQTGLVAEASVPERPKGLNLVMVAYYLGAMLMMFACAWFLGDRWDHLGAEGVLITTLAYASVSAGLGVWLRRGGYLVAGGLLVTVAVCLMPLVTYAVEDLLGLWPTHNPSNIGLFYPRVHTACITLELATIVAAAVALYFVRFGFLTAPLAASFWLLSMDMADLVSRQSYDFNQRARVSMGVGLATLFIGYYLQRAFQRRGKSRTEDFAFWCTLFGMLAFWGGLTSMHGESEAGRVVYLLVNLALIVIAVKLGRVTILVFGVLGVHVYLGHLAYEVFHDSVLFPFALALLGLSLILVTVLTQRWLGRKAQTAIAD